MPLDLHPNDNARESRPSIWIFQGRAIALLVVGVVVGVAVFRILDSVGVDWPINIPLSLSPLALIAAFVQLLVNGRPSRYATDLLLWTVWRCRARLYYVGVFDRPPQFWTKSRRMPPPPRDFVGKEVG